MIKEVLEQFEICILKTLNGWAIQFFPQKLNSDDFRINVGGKFCKQKYSASIFNISGMSFEHCLQMQLWH